MSIEIAYAILSLGGRCLFGGGSGFGLGGSLGGSFSLLCSLGGLGLGGSLGGGDFGFLLSYGFGLSLILLRLFLKSFLGVGLLGFTLFVPDGFEFSVFFSFPCVETALGFGLVKCALLDTALEMLHEHDAFAAKNVTDCVGGDGTNVNPIESALEI